MTHIVFALTSRLENRIMTLSRAVSCTLPLVHKTYNLAQSMRSMHIPKQCRHNILVHFTRSDLVSKQDVDAYLIFINYIKHKFLKKAWPQTYICEFCLLRRRDANTTRTQASKQPPAGRPRPSRHGFAVSGQPCPNNLASPKPSSGRMAPEYLATYAAKA